MNMRSKKTLFAVLFGMTGVMSQAQDYHFTQFDALAPSYQPAKTGMFTDKVYKASSQYRNQWRPLAANPFSTFGMSFELPLSEQWGVGGYLINYDGAKVFNAFNMVGSIAYQITDPRQKKHLLTTGLQVGLIYKNINTKDLLFDAQYWNGTFSSELSSNETFVRMNKLMPEFNAGVYYEWIDNSQDFHPYAGASIFHVTSPKEALLSDSFSRLPRRYLFNGGVKVALTRDMEVDLKGMYMAQEKARETLIGLVGKYVLPGSTTGFHLGSYYRFKDAISILAGIEYDYMTFIMSFDITTSGLKEYNGSRGAIEFTLSYAPGRE